MTYLKPLTMSDLRLKFSFAIFCDKKLTKHCLDQQMVFHFLLHFIQYQMIFNVYLMKCCKICDFLRQIIDKTLLVQILKIRKKNFEKNFIVTKLKKFFLGPELNFFLSSQMNFFPVFWVHF